MFSKHQPFHASFPLEIEEHIIDQLIDHFAALRRCSLTCRAWVPRSRFHLFGAIRIATKSALDAVLYYFRENQHMRTLVRSLVVAPVAPMERMRLFGAYPASLFQMLPNLHRWEMRAPVEAQTDTPRVSFHRTTLTQLRYSPITELCLVSMQFTSKAEFAQLISSLANLQALQYTDVSFGPIDTNGIPSTVASLYPRRQLGLSTLQVLHWKEEDDVLCWLLEVTKSSLQALVLRRRKSVKWQSATTLSMSQLYSLTLHIEQDPKDGIDTLHLEAFEDALHCVQALRYGTTLKQLEIHLYLCNPGYRSPREKAPCKDPVSLALFMSGDRLRGCCQMLEHALLADHGIHLTIVTHLPSLWTHREVVLRILREDVFPNLHRKGLLSVGYSGGNARECTSHSGPVSTLAVSPDSRWIVSSSSNLAILWDARTRRPIREWLHPHPEADYSSRLATAGIPVAFSPDSERLACCVYIKGRPPFIQILSVDKGSRLAVLEDPALANDDSPKLQLACSWLPDKVIFACLSRSTICVRIWDPHTFEPLSSWQDMLAISRGALLLSCDGRQLAVAATYGPSQAGGVIIHQTGAYPISARHMHHQLCLLWNLDIGGPSGVLRARSGQSDIRAASFDREGERLALSFWNHTIGIWSVATRELVLSLTEHIPLKFDQLYNQLYVPRLSVTSKAVAFSPDGRYLLSMRHVQGVKTCTLVTLWDTLTGQPLLQWDDIESSTIMSRNSGLAAFTPCGRYVAFTAYIERVHVFDLYRGGLPVKTHWGSRSEETSMRFAMLPTSHAADSSLVFSPDGQTLCLGKCGGGVEIRSF